MKWKRAKEKKKQFSDFLFRSFFEAKKKKKPFAFAYWITARRSGRKNYAPIKYSNYLKSYLTSRCNYRLTLVGVRNTNFLHFVCVAVFSLDRDTEMRKYEHGEFT